MQTRNTEQKRRILAILAAAKVPVSVDCIYRRARGELAKSTIYRNLEALVGKGVAERHYLEAKGSLYRIRAHGHAHFVVCGSCRRMVPIPGCNLRAFERKTELATGFVISGHYMQMSGTCGRCRKRVE
ncbi:MAG: transcriptional repressor [Rickettsiales bacterium]|jgi:Fe2+ or Zn2+ uptake regulation protein|nr:transcriptional repressor [Rickettsiales bacterium]